MSKSPEKETTPKWLHPSDVMKMHKLKQKKKALQARIKGNTPDLKKNNNTASTNFENVFTNKKRSNPFIKCSAPKKPKIETNFFPDESTDQTLFKLLHQNDPSPNNSYTSFSNIFGKIEVETVEIVKAQGKTWLPIDWTLKDKIRLIASKPFPWNQKLKVSEEASGITAFTRCLGDETENNLDSSPNAKFHQCCLYFIQPNLPWLQLFPRNSNKVQSTNGVAVNSGMKEGLHQAWCDSLRSLFQLVRTRQCPFFYACANNFTVLFRAAGISGFTDIHVLVTPTTRGFRHLLKQEEIEFTMPLKNKRMSDQGYETWDSAVSESTAEVEEEEEDAPDESWMKSMGINDADIKQINYSQDRMIHKAECEVDNSEQSLVMIEGVEVHSFYNFILNCKSSTAFTGPLAGIPPTLLAPVAFNGSSLQSLKVRESKVNKDNINFYSLELSGPILPNMIHNLFALNQPEHSLTATFNNLKYTECFSKVKNTERRSVIDNRGTVVFGKENLSDCGLLPRVLKHFCAPEQDYVSNVECLKYTSENKTFTWS